MEIININGKEEEPYDQEKDLLEFGMEVSQVCNNHPKLLAVIKAGSLFMLASDLHHQVLMKAQAGAIEQARIAQINADLIKRGGLQ